MGAGHTGYSTHMAKKHLSCLWKDADLHIERIDRDRHAHLLRSGNPRLNSISNVFESLFPGFALADATGKAGNLSDPTAIFMVWVKNYLSQSCI